MWLCYLKSARRTARLVLGAACASLLLAPVGVSARVQGHTVRPALAALVLRSGRGAPGRSARPVPRSSAARRCARRRRHRVCARRGAATGSALQAPPPPAAAPTTVQAVSQQAVVSPTSSRRTVPPQQPPPPVEPGTPFRFFSSTSFWNEPIPSTAQADPSSAALVGALDEVVAGEQQGGFGPWINTTQYSLPIYTVPAGQPTVAVELAEHRPEAALSSAWSQVPLPSDAQPSAGSDGDLAVWQPSTDTLWEFWRLSRRGSAWQASWGGAIEHQSASSGVYEAGSWLGAEPWWGTSASSLSLAGGLITIEDLKHGQINHALEMAIPAPRAGVFSSPARRTDGRSASPLALPEGAHLRLNPDLDLAALKLPRVTMMLAEAAQRYGIYVTDTSPVVELTAQDPNSTGSEPYTGEGGLFEGMRPSQLLGAFPWGQLEVLQMELHLTR